MNSYDSQNVVLGGSGIRVERVLEMEAPIESSYIHITKVFFSPQGFGKSKTIRGNSTLLSTLVEYCPAQYSWTSKKISEAFAIFTMTANSLGLKRCGLFGNMPVSFCQTTIWLFITKELVGVLQPLLGNYIERK